MKVNSIRTTGRTAQGVKLITLNDKEAIQEITLVIPDDEEGASEDETAELETSAEGAEAPVEAESQE